MTFSEKLKQAMQELHLSQRQVCGMTGKSKGSVSQYLSGKQIPSDDVQNAIAVALGLESDYFSKSDEQVVVLPTAELKNGVIPRLDVEKAAKLLQMNHNTVRKGLQQGVFPWGYGIHTSDNRWVYFINAKRFAEIEGITVQKVRFNNMKKFEFTGETKTINLLFRTATLHRIKAVMNLVITSQMMK